MCMLQGMDLDTQSNVRSPWHVSETCSTCKGLCDCSLKHSFTELDQELDQASRAIWLGDL